MLNDYNKARVDAKKLIRTLQRLGVPEADARITATVLVSALCQEKIE
jgi:hypothetical protein